jgi:hypothetical protein
MITAIVLLLAFIPLMVFLVLRNNARSHPYYPINGRYTHTTNNTTDEVSYKPSRYIEVTCKEDNGNRRYYDTVAKQFVVKMEE